MTAFQAEGCGIALSGDEYKVSVTGFTFSAIWHDRHSADWLAALASPYPASPDFPLFRGQNKTPRNTLFINGSTVSTGYSATVHILHRMCKLVKVSPKPAHKRALLLIDQPNCGGKVVTPATKGGLHFLARQGGCPVFAAKGGIYTGAPKGAHLASAAILYTSRGRSPQPVREASAGPGQNPWRPGPEARRRHQPSRRSRVNLREYWKAPLRSRSRPRQRRLNLQAP